MILFIVGLIVYGLSRAIQQALIFLHRDFDIIPEWVDESGEIHFWGYFEPIGLILAVCGAFPYVSNYGLLFGVSLVIMGYYIYWLPYAILFNRMRGRVWFLPMQVYSLSLFGISFRLPLPTLQISIIMFCVVIILCGAVYVFC